MELKRRQDTFEGQEVVQTAEMEFRDGYRNTDEVDLGWGEPNSGMKNLKELHPDRTRLEQTQNFSVYSVERYGLYKKNADRKDS